MAVTTLSRTIDTDTAGRVDLVVRDLSGGSRSQVRGLIDHGCVSINGVPCGTVARTVGAGDIVTICFDASQRYREKKKNWDDRAFRVVFEDESLIVVDKTAGTLTVPTDKHERHTLVERVSIYLSHSRGQRDAWVVHRLDRAVSGLLVLGKHEHVAQQLIEQFKQRKPERLYAAIVAGVVQEEQGTFRGHLATGKNLDRYVAPPSKTTEAAVTHYRVQRRMSDTTLVEVRLETGKRNQIRVHFADAGYPVLGDPRYKTQEAAHPRWRHKRIALHAKMLGFEHPVTKEPLRLESPLPGPMQKFLNADR